MMASENKTPCESVALAGCGGDHLISPRQVTGGGFFTRQALALLGLGFRGFVTVGQAVHVSRQQVHLVVAL